MRQLILKIESRCNLSCDYCYVYESLDQSWRRQPTVMSPETVAHVARRIREHAREQAPDQAMEGPEVVLHGGEPLLVGHEALAAMLGTLREARSEEHTSELQSQSNLVCRLLLEKK